MNRFQLTFDRPATDEERRRYDVDVIRETKVGHAHDRDAAEAAARSIAFDRGWHYVSVMELVEEQREVAA